MTGMVSKAMTMTVLLQRRCKTFNGVKVMEYQSNNSASHAGEDARKSASDAAATLKGAASDAASQFRSSSADLADQAQQAGGKVADATKAYAKDAVDAAGRKVSDVKSQLETAKVNATEYINDDPVRAVKIAAIGGAMLSAALVMLTRRSR